MPVQIQKFEPVSATLLLFVKCQHLRSTTLVMSLISMPCTSLLTVRSKTCSLPIFGGDYNSTSAFDCALEELFATIQFQLLAYREHPKSYRVRS